MQVLNTDVGGGVGATGTTRYQPITVNSGTGINADVADGLLAELIALEGLKGQSPETGMNVDGTTFINQYTNRLLGAPFQFLDSVDMRFPSINSFLGTEYMRNIMFNSPILYVKPGMPKYTGNIKADGIAQALNNLYMDTSLGGVDALDSILMSVGTMVSGSGKDLQRRMFGFKETYHQYMQHVNYMLHNIANLMGLTTGVKFPSVMFSSNGERQPLASAKWENYRMLNGTKVMTPTQQLGSMLGAVVDGPFALVSSAVTGGAAAFNALKTVAGKTADALVVAGNNYSNSLENNQDAFETLKDTVGGFIETLMSPSTAEELGGITEEAWSEIRADFANNKTVSEVIGNKVTSVQFMVDPVNFDETFNNEIGQSIIGGAIDGLNSIGQELKWISNSGVDAGIMEGVFQFVDGASDALGNIIKSASNVIGGSFISNLFEGAVQSVKGQKMLYPQIYKSSTAARNYNYSMTLTTPYGDPYNYFMNIIVPLIHLIALAAPRMVTSNTIGSPYLVQAFIPGMATCQLGMITNMQIDKNPTTKHVSVHGYPLTVKVTFTVSELYNNLSISPANDPSSFLFNETLNDYMCNLAGLIPSMDTFEAQRVAQQQSFEQYFTLGDRADDLSQMALDKFENFGNPFVGR